MFLNITNKTQMNISRSIFSANSLSIKEKNVNVNEISKLQLFLLKGEWVKVERSLGLRMKMKFIDHVKHSVWTI